MHDFFSEPRLYGGPWQKRLGMALLRRESENRVPNPQTLAYTRDAAI
jgi:hypothetical protein